MKPKRYSIIALSILIFLLGNANSIHYNQVIDYLGIPGPVKYDNAEYKLAWSASPEKNYFKQEYLPRGGKIDKFNKMILVEALATNSSLEDIVRIKLLELEKRKKDDPIVNYKLFNNPGKTDYMLDFLVSEGKDNLTRAEWNVYRYESFMDSSGHRGVMIFGFVSRETTYITDFLNNLGEFRRQQMKILASYPLPTINLTFN